MDTAVQTNVEEDVWVDCIIQEVAEAAMQTDPTEIQDGEAQTDETPLYTPLVREAIIKKLQNELLAVQQELAQYKEKVVPLHEHQGLRKKFESLTMIQDETVSRYKAEKNKAERLKGQLQNAREKMETVYSLYLDTLSCQAPATNYALFLMESYLLLKFKATKAGKPVEIKTTPDFIKCFKRTMRRFNASSVNYICIISF